jgi:hypothetical protein
VEENQPTVTEGPTASEVLRYLADEIDDYEGDVDRISVLRASNKEYVARLYATGADDWAGFLLTF